LILVKRHKIFNYVGADINNFINSRVITKFTFENNQIVSFETFFTFHYNSCVHYGAVVVSDHNTYNTSRNIIIYTI